ncbi:MAG: 5-formyltetrahydrofolate cyclo-ligase [Bacteroidota bacterium]
MAFDHHSLYISKKLLRRTLLHQRKLLDPKVHEQRNLLLLRNLEKFLQENPARSLHVFLPIVQNREPDITPLLPKLWEKGVQILASSTDLQRKRMCHFLLEQDTELVPNRVGIPEPIKGTEIALDGLDAMLVPSLMVDLKGNRIGYGGGYYDRLMKDLPAVKIGLSLSNPVDCIVQTDHWDVHLDFTITAKKIIKHG